MRAMATGTGTGIMLCMALLFTGAQVQGAEGGTKVLVHVVSFKFKEGTTPDQIKTIEEAFRTLKSKIPEVVSYEGGRATGKLDRNKGFMHCSVLTFKSEQDLDTYTNHPEHQAFKKMLGAMIDDVFVLDFWDNPPQ